MHWSAAFAVASLFKLRVLREDLFKSDLIALFNGLIQFLLHWANRQVSALHGATAGFLLLVHNGNEFVVPSLFRENVSGGSITIGVDAPVWIRAVPQEESQNLGLPVQHREVNRFLLIILGHIHVYQFRTGFQNVGNFGKIPSFYRVVESDDVDPVDAGFHFWPTVEPVFTGDYQLDVTEVRDFQKRSFWTGPRELRVETAQPRRGILILAMNGFE
jgi:hypothetical protein